MPREQDERRRIGLLYSWMSNEYILLAWVLCVVFVALFVAALWLLRLLCFGRGPGRWAATALERRRSRCDETGTWFGFSRSYAWHHRQVIRFQALYLLFLVVTCGVGLLLGAPFYVIWFSRARREAEQGGLHVGAVGVVYAVGEV